jgi:hypothetical protein
MGIHRRSLVFDFLEKQSKMSVLLIIFRLFILDWIPNPLFSHILFWTLNVTSPQSTHLVSAYDRLTDIRVPPLQELKTKIKQIRDYQQLMDQMEYEDDYEDEGFSLWTLFFGKKKLPESSLAAPLNIQSAPQSTIPLPVNRTSSNYSVVADQPSPTSPPWPSRPMTLPIEKPGSSLVIVDISRSIVQSVKTFGKWFDDLIGWKLF